MSDTRLVVVTPPRGEHRDGCVFGPGWYRIVLKGGRSLYFASQAELELAFQLLPPGHAGHVQRDGYCLDGEAPSKPGTPDVMDGEVFLNMRREDAMRELGIEEESEYARAYRAIEDAVLARDRLHHGTAERPSIVVKKRGARHVNDIA